MQTVFPKHSLLLAVAIVLIGYRGALAAESTVSHKELVGGVRESVGNSSNGNDSAVTPEIADVKSKDLSKESSKDPTGNPFDSLKAGFQHMKSGSYARALESFNTAARENPTSAEPHFGRAMALLGLSRREEAMKEFKLTMLLDPSSRMAHKCQREIDFSGLQKTDHSNQPRNITTGDLERTTSEVTNKAANEIRRIQAEAVSRAESMRRMDRASKYGMNSPGRFYSPRSSRYLNSRRSNYSSRSTSGGGLHISNYTGAPSHKSDSMIRARAISADVRLRSDALRDAANGLNSTMSSRPSDSSGVYLTPHGTNLFVRNYINFDPVRPEPPEALSARTLSLEDACCGATDTRTHQPGCSYALSQRNPQNRNFNKFK